MWRERVNDTLARLTGLRVERAQPAATPGGRGRGARQRAGQRAGRSRPRRPGSGAARRAGGTRLPHHYDEAAKRIIRRVRPRTMTAHEKMYALILATRYVARHDVPGALVECGVWRGGSMQAVAFTLHEVGATDRDLHLFDTFEGMPPPTAVDRRPGGKSAEQLLREHDRDSRVWAVAGIDDVQEAMAETGYPPERIRFHRGLVEQTIPDEAPAEIALLRLDTDWYESTRHELTHLYDRLVPGGVLLIDDYGNWEGCRRATEEFLAATGAPLLLLPMSAGRIAVKPRV